MSLRIGGNGRSEMLVLMLVVATTFRLCPLVKARPLCRIRTLRTGKVFPVEEKIQGVGTPEVTSAHFAGSVLLLVVNQKVYVYDYEANFWTASTGIQHPVSHVSGDNCCYSGNSFCMDISNSVFAYLRGDQVSQANIYFSNSRGYRFQKYTQERRAELVGTFGGIFSFHSLSQVGLLLVDEQMAMFSYSDHPLNRSFGLPFDYDRALDILIAPGQKGILIFWSEKNLLVSRNSGQLVESVQVREGQRILYNSIVKANITIHSVAANENELAVLTEENNLYYGSLGIQSSSLIKFADQNIWSQEAVLMFTDVGMLEILTPLRDVLFPAFDFQKCRLNIQALLMDPQLQAGVCKVELLQGEFENKMYTIDMNSQLELTALMIPRPGMLPVPLVSVSNPHSLGLQAVICEDGYTYDGNTKHRLNISLKQQHHWGRADPNFTSSIKRPTISTITLDIANKEISCVDLKPLTALISVGCDLEKKIVIQNELSACYHGVLDPVALQDNYSYIIEREAYDPNFQGQQAKKDLEVHYPYEKLGCPLLAYYDIPWKPVVELWREGKFQEVVEAEYVLLEMNGLFTYTYSLTASTAGCSAQPQNWTTITKMAGDTAPFSWDREVRPALLNSPRARLGRRLPVLRSVCWEPARPVQAAANRTPETPGAFKSSMGFSRILEVEVQHQGASRFGVWFMGDASCVLTEQKGWGSSSRCVCAQVRVQSCPTLQPRGLWPRCRPPPAPPRPTPTPPHPQGSSGPGILRERILEWVAISCSRPRSLYKDTEQLTGSKLGKEYDKAVYCHPTYLT
ncbi:cation channel sperm-associated auxiliary subunit delta isoform X5 [Bos taurus]|uniref:cation channel sperm-associated auxiliary subunit delta isoform X5 n=1 Tax=Bos taurus TaxID=9913 RepID=UPI0028CB9D73|nr:cation channel sperm-associated auxiliary subunit delta isoform X5 [Bos taurus]